MAQNINPERSQPSNIGKQNDEPFLVKDSHAVSKR